MKKTKDIFGEIVPELKKQKFNIDIDEFLDFMPVLQCIFWLLL